MKIYIMLLLLIGTFLNAQELSKAESYEAAKAQAFKENKYLMVLITTENCRYCKKMKKTTFVVPKVIDRIEKDYIFVEVNRDFDEYPDHLTVYGVPTTYFLYNDGEPIMRAVGGYWNSVDFLSFMDDADRKLLKGRE